MIKAIRTTDLPMVGFYVAQDPESKEWEVGVRVDDKKQRISVFWTKSQAEAEYKRLCAKAGPNMKRAKREMRRCSPKPIDRKLLQAYLIYMSDERAAQFYEGMFTLNVLMQCLTYCFDEMEGNYDEFLNASVRQSFMIARKQINRMLDTLYDTRILGEDNDGFEAVTQISYRMLDLVNALTNYGWQERDAFRMAEVEKTLKKVLPDDEMLRRRKEFAHMVRRIFGDMLNGVIEKANHGL